MDKILNYISIGAKGGLISGGGLMTESLIRQGKAKIVILAEDASDNTKKDILSMCEHYHTPCIEHGDRESLGRASGKGFRASIVITDRGLAEAVKKAAEQSLSEK